MWKQFNIFFSLVKKPNHSGMSWVSTFIERLKKKLFLMCQTLFMENFLYPLIKKSLILLFFMSNNIFLLAYCKIICQLVWTTMLLKFKIKSEKICCKSKLNGIFLKYSGHFCKIFLKLQAYSYKHIKKKSESCKMCFRNFSKCIDMADLKHWIFFQRT